MKHHRNERTLVVVKPDGVQRSLVGEIIRRFERVGLKIAAMKLVTPTTAHIEKHYTLDPEWLRLVGEKTIKSAKERGHSAYSDDPVTMGKKVLEFLVKYMASGPVVAIVLEGAHAVEIVRKLTGSTEPLSSDVGTIRGDFVLDSYKMSNSDGRATRNLIHASGSVKEAEQEIPHWFSKDEIISYAIVQEKILYDVNLDGIFE